MSLIGYLIGLFFSGLVVGALGRLLHPGRDPMSIMETVLLGIAASFITGLILWGIWGRNGGSFVISVLVAVGLVALISHRRRSALGTAPGRGRLRRGF